MARVIRNTVGNKQFTGLLSDTCTHKPHHVGAQYLVHRHKATAAPALKEIENEPSKPEVLPFEDIPGEKGLPFVGNMLSLLKNKGESHIAVQKRFKEFGPIYREKIGPLTMVYLSDIEAIEKLFRFEGKYPIRINIPHWVQWREDNKLEKGVLTQDGPDWKRMRKIMDKRMLRPIHVKTYTDNFNEVTTDFIHRLRHIRTNSGEGVTVPHMDVELFHWSLETIGTVLYERRFGGLQEERDPMMAKFISAVQSVFKTTETLTFLPSNIARIFTPKLFRQHEWAWKTIFETSLQLIQEKTAEIVERVERGEQAEGFLSHLLMDDKLSEGELNANISEIMLGAVDTTSNTTQWVLYHLAANPDIQAKLHTEVMEATDEGSRHPSNQDLQNMPYLKAIIKEVLRLYPVAGANIRVTQEDMELRGYHIPKGTTVLGSSWVTGRDPAYFEDPERFWPERWLRTGDQEDSAKHPFAWLPFGFGPRMCIGRRVADLEMQLLISRMSQEFVIKPLNDTPLRAVTRGIIVPERSVEVKLIDRK